MNDRLIIVLIFLLYFSPVFYQLIKVLKERKKEYKKTQRKLLSYTKYSIATLFFSIIFLAILSHINFLNYEKPMTFDKYNQITFQNFRGLEFFKKTLYGNEKFAYIVTSINSKIHDDSVTINSLFHPSRSFVYNKHTNSTDLLTHEKYHFKITELFVRKAKNKISKLNQISKNEIKKIIKNIKEEERLFQKEYDSATFHSYVYNQQKKYEKEIDSLLNLLNEFKKTKIKFNEKN
ncbi:hypothetical protein [uncultured Tenacibaculum sp.]|uniref:hypothetical protein n=1 Tax=uncultured Tenacibaculum sp. TaxID=174713 RepID=UPI002637B20F|nr:hypothetical protein [uncultured Tenacibaculum sp.]